jgi:hypothetical protein
VSGSRFVQSGFDRRPTDQVHVLRQVLHDASAAVKTVAGDHEHPLGKPRRDLREQFHSQFRTRFVARRCFFLRLVSPCLLIYNRNPTGKANAIGGAHGSPLTTMQTTTQSRTAASSLVQ